MLDKHGFVDPVSGWLNAVQWWEIPCARRHQWQGSPGRSGQLSRVALQLLVHMAPSVL